MGIVEMFTETDVLVVGGGLAGTVAAIGAAEKGAAVVVMDKGKIERSGDIGGGVDHFLAYLETGAEWDTKEAFLKYAAKTARGAVELEVVEKIYCAELMNSIALMARIGNPLTQPDGSYSRMQSGGQPGPWWINFDGSRLKPRLAKEVRKLGCHVLDRVMATGLLTCNNGVAGAVGFNIRTGEFHIVRAKATIICTGNTNRLFESPRINPFDTWRCPFDTGDGQVMAYEAGAALTNMEYIRVSIMPKGFSAAGFNALTGMGGRLLNSLGEYYMEERHSHGSKAPRYDTIYYTLQELKAGRGPIYIDCRHLDEDVLEQLVITLGYDKNTLPDYIEQRGENLKRKPIEIMFSEGTQNGPCEVAGGGVLVDANCASTVNGLFACGDASSANSNVHGAVTGGYRAGKSAARFAGRVGMGDIDKDQVHALRENTFAALDRKDGISYTDYEDMIRKINSDGAGMERTGNGLVNALEKLKRVRAYYSLVKARDLHELMRANESYSLLRVSELMVAAAIYRQESRFGPYHYRIDYPEQNDQNWFGQVIIERNGEQAKLSFRPVSYGAFLERGESDASGI